MTATTAKHVAVIGGSLSGLSVGHALLYAGYDVHIYEKSPAHVASNDQGAGIVMQKDTSEVLLRYKLVKSLDEVSVVAKQRQYLDKQGNITKPTDYEQRMTSWNALFNAMRSKFDDSRYHNSHQLTKYERAGEKVKLQFKHQQKDDKQAAEDITVEADYVIGADGQRSTVRQLLQSYNKLKPSEPQYAGYVAWRGIINESEMIGEDGEKLQQFFDQKFTWFFSEADKTHTLIYYIPGKEGEVAVGKRRLNWVWYWDYEPGSQELKELLTDKHGHEHQYSVGIGLLQPKVIEQQAKVAHRIFPPQCRQLWDRTNKTFIQVIVDHLVEQRVYEDGHVLLVGDSACSVRPHTAAATSQAAANAMELADAVKDGQWNTQALKQWQQKQLERSQHLRDYGIRVGDVSQFPERTNKRDDLEQSFAQKS